MNREIEKERGERERYERESEREREIKGYIGNEIIRDGRER